MKKIIIFCTLAIPLIFVNSKGFCQVGINTFGVNPDPSALLDIDVAGMSSKKGLLIPRVPLTSSIDATTIVNPANSLLVYNLGTGGFIPAGYYYNLGTPVSPNWIPFLTNNANTPSAWSLTGNTGTTASTSAINSLVNNNFIGTTDVKDFVFVSNNLERMRIAATGNVGIGTISPDNSAKIDIVSTTQGFSMPRMTTVQRLAIASPANGLQVYDTDLSDFYYFNTSTNKWDCVSVRAGTVNYFANINAPVGYLECNGQSVSTTIYPELFNAIGYTYGGSGANFKVPDLRGEFVRGLDNGRGVDVGRVLGSWEKGSLVAYDINVDGVWCLSTVSTTLLPSQNEIGADNYNTVDYPNVKLNGGNPTVFGTALPGAPINQAYSGTSRPRNIALLPCIKY